MEPIGSFIAGELLEAVKDVGTNNFDFKNYCRNLQGTLEILIPKLEKVAYDQWQDDRQKAFKEFCVKLQTGMTLLQNCSKVPHMDIFRTYRYAKKLERFNRDIVESIQTMGWILRYGEIQDISHRRADLSAEIDKLDQLENGESASPSSIPKLPDCSDGLEISVGEQKKPLLSEDVQLLGDLETESSSNTALLTAFRNDKEFQGTMRQNPGLQFDVFINFMGIDVKNRLASFIYHLLMIKDPNLRVYLDENDIPSGVDFAFAIERAIQSSSVHIAIFSEQYAESEWCLHELDLIIKSKRQLIPVFCDVDPAALRRIEKGCYQKAFEQHRGKEPLEKTKRWENSLARASYLQGFLFKMKETDMGDVAVKIADTVLENLKEGSLVDAQYPRQ